MAETIAVGRTPKAIPTMALPEYQRRKRRNLIILLVLILLVLMAIGVLFYRYYFYKEKPLPQVEEIEPGRIYPPTFLFNITGPDGELHLRKPLDVAIHPQNGNIYVTSKTSQVGKGRIEVFKPDGTYMFNFSKIDGGQIIDTPSYIAIDSKGQVVVTDWLMRAIFVFTTDGKFVKRIHYDGDKDHRWIPLAIAFDKKDDLYITDVYSNKVIKMDMNGKVLLEFGGTGSTALKGKERGKFFYPNGIFID